ncbi:MAG: DUF4114 domain-containing protein [Cyanobacteria bacterium P01_D01_bin.1]
MLDFSENGLSQDLNTAVLFPDAMSAASVVENPAGQIASRNSSVGMSMQRLADQPFTISNSTALNEDTAFNSLSEAGVDTQMPDGVDSLLAGGLLDQTSLDSAKGTFVVGDSGSVAIDFLFDGGHYTGELAVFTLAGMGGLGIADFAQEAARRSLSGTAEGQVVITDRTEGAQFSGELGERDRNQGSAASTKSLTIAAGTRFALMLVPDSTIAAVAAGEILPNSSKAPIFSIAAYNPGGHAQLAQAAEDIFAIEDMQIGKGDADFNDIVFRVEGAATVVSSLSQLAAPDRNWLANPAATAFLSPEESTLEEIPPFPENPAVDPPVSPPNSPPTDSTIVVDVSGAANKFTGTTSEEDIIATGADSVTFDSQTVYIGTEQVSPNNQNPIIRSFDPVNTQNNWTRRDLETTRTDGRGLGLIWTGTSLYGVFSVDGTQGTAAEDFRRATQSVKQNWLRSYGAGGSGKVAVIGQIDPNTGALLKAAYLSSIKQNGNSNSLSITGATVNSAGNLVLTGQSFFSPRRPNGSALTKDPGNTQGSPFDYTVEITADLTEVISTAADGWS